MYLHCLKYSIFLVLVSSQRSATASDDGVDHGRNASAKILTNLWKVPWMNLNSSWTDEVAPDCANDISTLFQSADAGHMWALRMLDASTKIPAGILKGNIYDLGMYDECVKVTGDSNPAEIQGQQCRVSLGMPPKFISNAAAMLHMQKLSPFNPTPGVELSFGAAVCLPSSCSVDDVTNFIKASIRSDSELSRLEVRVAQVQCSTVEGAELTPATILVLSYFSVTVTVLTFCTACDFLITARPDASSLTLRTLARFSLYSNFIKLMNTEVSEEPLQAIHGLRFISVFAILSAHRLLIEVGTPLVNLGDIYEFRSSLFAAVSFTLPLFVDTFFLLSGFLTTYTFFKHLQSGAHFSLLEFYLNRYQRVAPSVAVVILFVIFVQPYLGSGPLWDMTTEITSGACQRNWWANMLFVNNLFNNYGTCLAHTWYLAAEMQLYWISPIILYPLYRRPQLGLAILSAFLIASFILPVIAILTHHFAALSLNVTRTFEGIMEDFYTFNIRTYYRSLPYFLGIYGGYIIVDRRPVLPRAKIVVNWMLTCFFIMVCVWTASVIQPMSPVYYPEWEALYASMARLAWCTAMTWIIHASSRGLSGPLGRFLSLPIFMPLSRLTFGIYLISFVLQVAVKGTQHTAGYHTNFEIMYLVWGDLAVSTLLAVILKLCCETPMMVLDKITSTIDPEKTKIISNMPTRRNKSWSKATVLRVHKNK